MRYLLQFSSLEDVKSGLILLTLHIWLLNKRVLSVTESFLLRVYKHLLRRVRVERLEALANPRVLNNCYWLVLFFLFSVLILVPKVFGIGIFIHLLIVLVLLLFRLFLRLLCFLFFLFNIFWSSYLFLMAILQIKFWFNCYPCIIQVLKLLPSVIAFRLSFSHGVFFNLHQVLIVALLFLWIIGLIRLGLGLLLFFWEILHWLFWSVFNILNLVLLLPQFHSVMF